VIPRVPADAKRDAGRPAGPAWMRRGTLGLYEKLSCFPGHVIA
jgi:hypothetical protein